MTNGVSAPIRLAWLMTLGQETLSMCCEVNLRSCRSKIYLPDVYKEHSGFSDRN